MLRIGVSAAIGAAVGLTAALLAVGYDVVPLDVVSALAGRARANAEWIGGGLGLSAVARMFGPAAVVAMRAQAVEFLRGLVAEAMPGKR